MKKIKYLRKTRVKHVFGGLGLIALISFSSICLASGNHEGGHSHDTGKMQTNSSHDHGDMKNDKAGMFLKEKNIDGYKVSFHVMEANDGMRHGGSHNFMVKVEKDGKALKDVVINSKVVHPNKNTESKMLMKMGDWYMAGYDLSHMGKHQMMILFKTSDGKKHKGGVYYSK